MVILESISKRFGERPVLDALSMRFFRKQTHALLGASGCGKSTILRLICGLTQPDSGSVRVDGLPVDADNQPAILRKIGYVLQEGALFPHLSAADNVTLAADAQGWAKDATQKRLHSLADLVNIDAAMLKRFPRQLSGGQRQRISLMRALMLDPELLLLDEPLAALDPMVRADLQTELKRIFAELDKTVILVTHDIREAALFGETITLLHNGGIEQQGSVDQLRQHPQSDWVRRFFAAQVGNQ